jgi:flagellar protein FlaJ
MQKEAKEVAKDVELFGIDPLSAMEKAAKTHPLDIYRDFMSGYASSVITGGDVSHFLETKTQDIFKIRSQRIRAVAERLGMLLESFIIIMVLMSLCFYILFSIESIYSVSGMSLYSGLIMYTFIFTPLLSVVFIYFAHDMQPKSPITDWLPYKVCGISVAAAALVFCMLSGFMGLIQVPFLNGISRIVTIPWAVAITLIITVTPASLVYERRSRKRSGVENGIADFLRDLTEVRKTGLSPEKCIESLSKRDYGVFKPELQKISSELSWGIPLRQVFMDFVKRTKSWISQIVVFLLVEAIDVGGGTIAMIESLARFNQMTRDVDREKKMAVRPYIIVPYFAATLLTATTLMMLAFLGKTVSIAGTSSTVNLASIQSIFTISVIIHSYIIGLVAGKISEESVAAGFKHSALLVVITVVASVLIPNLVKL